MTKKEEYRERLAQCLAEDAAAELEDYLLASSGLPGPRGNLELAHALADLLARDPPGPAVRERLEAWWAISAAEAATGDPREYLAFCATLALSAFWRGSRTSRAKITRRLREAAIDSRWRRREAAAMALQRIGEKDPDSLPALLESWVGSGSFLELRAVAAALAHPPLLEEAAFARQALILVDRILKRVAAAAPAVRREEGFRVLRQGLGYALSVLVAAQPPRGFALLERWAARRATLRDPDIVWILRENLKKKRLARFPEQARRVSALLGGS